MAIRRSVAALAATLLISACGRADAPTTSTSTASTSTTSTSTTAVDTPTTTATATTATITDAAVAAPCRRSGTEVTGAVAQADLDEASGLVASRTHPGVLWSHNDGGDRPGVFAIGADGSDLGFHPLGVEAVDLEDIAISGGADGDLLHLADIGDNLAARSSISVFRFAEPDPAAPAPIDTVERFDFVYPDGAHNAEALMIDESRGSIVIVTKEQALDSDGAPDPFGATGTAIVFEGALGSSTTVALTEVASLDTVGLEAMAEHTYLHPSTLLGFGGVVTGGDVSADASLVALRTYEAVWVWERSEGRPLAEVFADTPCQVVSVSETQGEAIAFDGEELLTLGEGVNQPINRLGR